MTELQMGLIGLGVLAVAGVLAYNKWQEARQKKQVENALELAPDILFGGDENRESPQEISQNRLPEEEMPSPPARERETPRADEPRIEPVLRAGAEPESSPTNPGAAASSKSESLLSPHVDFIAVIDTVEPVPEQRILEAPKEALSRLTKPVRWIGQDDEGEWRLISGGGSGEGGNGKYQHIRVGLQLVDRQGPVDGDDLTIFSAAIQDLADQLTGIVDLPPRQVALETAKELDQFCAGVDIQVGINVISRGQPFVGTKLRALAESAGMILENGRFVRRDDENKLFTMFNQEPSAFSVETMRMISTHGVTFLLDVPNVAHGERAFNLMIDLARRFADVLRGAMVDDNRHPLSDAALAPIRRQITQRQSTMAARRIPAGSPLALRLFS